MELVCFYAWWILTNSIMQYASFQFLAAAGRTSCGPGIGRGPSAGRAALWLAANGFLTLVNTAFHITGAFLLYGLLLVLFSRFVLSLKVSAGLVPVTVILTLCTLTEGFSALIMYWVSSNLHSAAAGQIIQMLLSLAMDAAYLGALKLAEARYTALSRMGARSPFCLPAACLIFVLSIQVGMKLYDFGFEPLLRSLGLSASTVLFFIMAGGTAVFFAALRLFQGNLYLAAQQAEAFLLQKRQQGLEAYLALIRKQNQEYTSFQHDIGNHLLVVSELIRGRHYEEAASYADKLYKNSRFATEIRSTGSLAADVLLREKLGYAGECGIKTICRVRIPRAFIPYEAELCAILSNLLDNGIAACVKEEKESPFLSIKTKEKAGFLFFEVCNSAKNRGTIKEGTGLGNVRKIAAAFGGTVDIENSDGIFRVRVLLYLPNTDQKSLTYSQYLC